MIKYTKKEVESSDYPLIRVHLGDEFKYRGKKYKVVKGTPFTCNGCYFSKHHIHCMNFLCEDMVFKRMRLWKR